MATFQAIPIFRSFLMRPGIEVAPWNARVMEMIDPFGNRLRFNEPIGAS